MKRRRGKQLNKSEGEKPHLLALFDHLLGDLSLLREVRFVPDDDDGDVRRGARAQLLHPPPHGRERVLGRWLMID